MATSSPVITFDNSSNAAFQAWVTAFDNAMLAVGFLHSSDTGQANPATITAPTAANQSRGYIIYTPNDGLTDYYIRVDFGSGNSGTLAPAIYLILGWSTDGAGNFTGLQITSTILIRIINANAATGALTTRFCKSGSAWVFSLNEAQAGASVSQQPFFCDRSRDSAGNPTTSGFQFGVGSVNSCQPAYGGSFGTAWTEYVASSGGKYGAIGGTTRSPYAAPPVSTTWSRGSNIGIAPIVCWDAGGQPVGIAGLMISPTDATIGTTFTASIYGVSHTYRQCGGLMDNGALGRLCHIWE